MDSCHDAREDIVDIVGIGFGPSNLALAIAVTEHNEHGGNLTAEFVERKPAFGWHRGMLLDGATMQVSFLKDLATMRNPVSRFGFLPYLHDRGRLPDFINHKTTYPSRVEFHDYLEWCARRMSRLVTYGAEVVGARPVVVDGMVDRYEVSVRDTRSGQVGVRQARNLVVAVGLRPQFPQGIVESRHVWHSSVHLERLRHLDVPDPRSFVVIGAGQSAAEVTDHLHREFPQAEVYAVFSRYGYSQADDSPYANRVFDPAAVDRFHRAPEEVKRSLAAYHANTNYSVVDVDLVEDLYRRAYQEKVRGVHRLHVFNLSSVVEVRETPDRAVVTVRHNDSGQRTVIEADAVICATGYRPVDPRSVLGEVTPLLWTDDAGRLKVERDYRVATGPEVLGGVYLCGGTEHSHGITSSLLSNTAVRAGEILRSVVERVEQAAMSSSYSTNPDHV